MQRLRQRAGFSLIELLTVIAVMAVLLSVTALAIPGLLRGNQLNSGLSALSDTFALARQYAVSNNTYVWVVLSGGTSGQPMKVAVLASASGTDSLKWTSAPVMLPSSPTGSYPDSDLQMISPVQNLAAVDIQNSPGVIIERPQTATVALSQAMDITIRAGGQSTAFNYAIQFTPTGEAKTSPSMSRYIELAIYPQQGGVNAINQAVLRVSGVTGATVIYRN